MKRLVYFNLPHKYLIQQLVKYPSLKVITPTLQAARALKLPHQSLETLAKRSLVEAGIRVAPILIALRLLHTAVSTVIQTSDVEGTTRAQSSAVKAILRAGINLESLAAASSNRTQQLALLTQTYISLLREFEDAAQAARREVISFYALLQTPTLSLTFSYPQMIGKEVTLPSPYLSRLKLEVVQPLPLPIASLEEARQIYLRRETLPDDDVLPVLERACVQPDFRQPEAEFFHVEQKFTGEWYGLNIKGIIDRIDRTPQVLVLLDYKTSSQVPPGIKDASGKANIDIQLPLYIHFASTTLFPGETVHEAYYYSVTKGKKLSNKQPSQETLEAYEAEIFTSARTLAVRFNKQKLSFIPVYSKLVRFNPILIFVKRSLQLSKNLWLRLLEH
ncbi:PD-(D/E)XK nuclease family protein [Nostoc sp.]|uniref:PD-(D/E)XK nuclease family protein n=1 Tax=Nostoc sp. TaxID=1180 RepID=UPI002FF63198